jgi:hypothetical protein
VRDYGRVHSAFWSSADMRSLSDDDRLLALYLMSCPHATIAGVFRLPDGYGKTDADSETAGAAMLSPDAGNRGAIACRVRVERG